MNVKDDFRNAFQVPLSGQNPPSEFIEANPFILELLSPVDLLSVVPAYMQWCLDHPSSPSLVVTGTIWALAEYGRSQSPENTHLNFKFLCNEAQAKAVARFLEWCKRNQPYAGREQIDRAHRRWQNTANRSFQRTAYGGR